VAEQETTGRPPVTCTTSASRFVGSIDVLEPSAAGWIVNEVKASNSVKPHHVLDLAVQVFVLRACGINVAAARLMHLNRDCRFPDLSNLFVVEDLTTEVEAELPRIPKLVEQLRDMLEQGEPIVSLGPRCRKPYACPFILRCFKAFPGHLVEEFYRLHDSKRLKLASANIKSISEVPAKFKLTAIQERQRRAILSGKMVVEGGPARALEFPDDGARALMDFETIYFPIPQWDGCRPWQQIPVQFSVHRETGGEMEQVAY